MKVRCRGGDRARGGKFCAREKWGLASGPGLIRMLQVDTDGARKDARWGGSVSVRFNCRQSWSVVAEKLACCQRRCFLPSTTVLGPYADGLALPGCLFTMEETGPSQTTASAVALQGTDTSIR
jgi:hypothetical protein